MTASHDDSEVYSRDPSNHNTFQTKHGKITHKKHVKTIEHDKNCSCNLCNYKTIHKKYQIKHTQRNNMTYKQTFSCVKHHAREQMFSCELCDFKTTQSDSLKTHVRDRHRDYYEVHSKDPIVVLTCEICAYKTWSKAQLTNHAAMHTGTTDEFFKCHKCLFESREVGEVARHAAERDHTWEKKIFCKICVFSTVSASLFRKHIWEVHQARFVCDLCDYCAKDMATFLKHNNEHSRHFTVI